MTTDEQIKALAELDGCESKMESISYDTIIPLIQKQPDEIKHGIERWNCCYHVLDATPLQLCEALLRATGKWKE